MPDSTPLDFTAQKAAIEKLKTVKASVVELLNSLSASLATAIQNLADAGNSPEELAELQGIADGINTEADEIAAAVLANTPAAKP